MPIESYVAQAKPQKIWVGRLIDNDNNNYYIESTSSIGEIYLTKRAATTKVIMWNVLQYHNAITVQ